MKNRIAKQTAAAIAVLTLLGSSCASSEPAGLLVEIEGLNDQPGVLVVSLYASEQSFLNSAAAEQTVPVPSAGSAFVEFLDLAAGTYAVAVYHDENSNGKMDTNFIGMPKERVGLSNNFRPRFGPPTFDKASFSLEPAGGSISIDLDF